MSVRPRNSACHALRVALLLAWCIISLGCNTSVGRGAREERTALGGVDEASALISYPRGAWRLLEEEALGDVVVWPAHILIRHAEADDQVPFSQYEWHTPEPAPSRSRAQAIALAQGVAARAAAHPDEFAALVAEYSEDAPTRACGGELGGLRAADMAGEPEVLDALAALRVGEVSRPVETTHGVHVVLRKAPPEPGVVAGRRFVVGHVGTGWKGRNSPRRTRAEAHALAQQVAEQLRGGSAALAALAGQSSVWHDARGGNELGTWSLREPGALGRVLAVLRGLEVGEVAAPFEGPLGVEVVVRTESASPAPQPSAQTELPAFVRPGLERLLARVPPRVVVQELDAVVESAPFEAASNPDQPQLLAEIRARAEPHRASTLAGPPRAAFADSVAAFLATDETSRYRFWLEERLSSRLLNARVTRYQYDLAR